MMVLRSGVENGEKFEGMMKWFVWFKSRADANLFSYQDGGVSRAAGV